MTPITHRSPVAVVIFSIVTLGIYAIYWVVKTKGEINGLGGKIPTAWLIIIPLANIYFIYRYSEDFSIFVKKDNNPILWFLLWMVIGPVAMILTQIEFNKLATEKSS
jgi:UDP-N-acetylmuramyl pentapeptide phosphotransferase/UDP-N-acetylglucosamine-1-phosphate transferase